LESGCSSGAATRSSPSACESIEASGPNRPVVPGARPLARSKPAYLLPSRAAGHHAGRNRRGGRARPCCRPSTEWQAPDGDPGSAAAEAVRFQIVEKSNKNPEPGEATTYEEIFRFTQTAMQQRRPRGVRLYSASTPAGGLVRMASDERYPWSFIARGDRHYARTPATRSRQRNLGSGSTTCSPHRAWVLISTPATCLFIRRVARSASDNPRLGRVSLGVRSRDDQGSAVGILHVSEGTAASRCDLKSEVESW